MTGMRISIAMATYNGSKYLTEQLNSFTAQVLPPDELVVCDDGSSDDTLQLLEAFRQRAPFEVHISRNDQNLGYKRNFAKAISLCSGDVVFLSDQDDAWFPEKIQLMAGFMAAHPRVFVLQSDMLLADEQLRSSGRTQLQNIRAMGYSDERFVTGCGTAIRKNWFNFCLPIPDEAPGHDGWIHRLAVALRVRSVIDKPLQHYRRHGNNVSQWQASSLSAVNALSGIRACGLSPAIEGWQRELNLIKLTRERILSRTDQLRDMGLGPVDSDILKDLDDHAQAYAQRISNCQIPRSARFLKLSRMYAQGDYKYFSGFSSFLKDIVRP